MKNRIVTKERRKEQKDALQEALDLETSQGSALRRIKVLASQYPELLKLSDFQKAILDNQSDYFKSVVEIYTPTQKKKVKQMQLIKDNKPLIMKMSYSVIVTKDEATLKTFGSKDKATKFMKASSIVTSKLSIIEKETPISTKFTPAEMLGRLHELEKRFFSQFSGAKNVTVAMLNTSIGKRNSQKDKDISKRKKQAVKAKKAGKAKKAKAKKADKKAA